MLIAGQRAGRALDDDLVPVEQRAHALKVSIDLARMSGAHAHAHCARVSSSALERQQLNDRGRMSALRLYW